MKLIPICFNFFPSHYGRSGPKTDEGSVVGLSYRRRFGGILFTRIEVEVARKGEGGALSNRSGEPE